jgi:hypothetical protein
VWIIICLLIISHWRKYLPMCWTIEILWSEFEVNYYYHDYIWKTVIYLFERNVPLFGIRWQQNNDWAVLSLKLNLNWSVLSNKWRLSIFTLNHSYCCYFSAINIVFDKQNTSISKYLQVTEKWFYYFVSYDYLYSVTWFLRISCRKYFRLHFSER